MTVLQPSGLTKISAQSDLVYWSYYLNPSKVEKGKYPESETWHPENIDGWSYFRLFKNF